MQRRTIMFLALRAAPAPALAQPSLTARLVRNHTERELPGSEVAFSADSRVLASANVDGTITLRRLSDGATLRVLQSPAGVTSIAYSPAGRWLATGSYDGARRLWRNGAAPSAP